MSAQEGARLPLAVRARERRCPAQAAPIRRPPPLPTGPRPGRPGRGRRRLRGPDRPHLRRRRRRARPLRRAPPREPPADLRPLLLRPLDGPAHRLSRLLHPPPPALQRPAVRRRGGAKEVSSARSRGRRHGAIKSQALPREKHTKKHNPRLLSALTWALFFLGRESTRSPSSMHTATAPRAAAATASPGNRSGCVGERGRGRARSGKHRDAPALFGPSGGGPLLPPPPPNAPCAGRARDRGRGCGAPPAGLRAGPRAARRGAENRLRGSAAARPRGRSPGCDPSENPRRGAAPGARERASRRFSSSSEPGVTSGGTSTWHRRAASAERREGNVRRGGRRKRRPRGAREREGAARTNETSTEPRCRSARANWSMHPADACAAEARCRSGGQSGSDRRRPAGERIALLACRVVGVRGRHAEGELVRQVEVEWVQELRDWVGLG